MSASFLAELTSHGLILSQVEFSEPSAISEFEQVLGPSSRVLDPAGGSVGRRPKGNLLHMYDDLGLYLLEHRLTRKIAEVHFVLDPTDVVHATLSPYNGVLLVNGKPIVAGMVEHDLPSQGDLHFLGQLYGWKAAMPRYYVTLEMKRPRDGMGRRIGEPALVSTTFGFERAHPHLAGPAVLDQSE